MGGNNQKMNITLLLKLILLLVAAVYTYVLVPFIKAKTTDSQLESLKSFVRVGVRAAEMMYKEHGMGELKKKYVLSYLQDLGYEVNLEEIDAIIEGAVFELKNDLK